MRFIGKIRFFKNRLLWSSALVSAVFFAPVPLKAACNETICTIDGRYHISDLDSGLADGIYDSRTYQFTAGTWEGIGGDFGGITNMQRHAGENYNGTYLNGIYQASGGGIVVSNPSFPPVLDFTAGGVLWDYSMYLNNVTGENPYIVFPNGERIRNREIGGDISISSGRFQGAIDIRKGSNRTALSFDVVNEMGVARETIFSASSAGNISISGGQFDFSQDSKIVMYDNNTGGINISGGQWNVGREDNAVDVKVFAIGGESYPQPVTIIGGQFNIAKGSTLWLYSRSGTGNSLSNDYSNLQISGAGTLALAFPDFTIKSDVTWEEGTLRQVTGTLTIDAGVSVSSYSMDSTSLVLDGTTYVTTGTPKLVVNKDKYLSIKNNILLNGQISGSGALILSEAANAEIGILNKFGTITLKRGKLTFFRGNDTDEWSLMELNGATGTIGEQIGIINVASRLLAKEVNLGNAALLLNEELIVESLNIQNGQVVFVTDQKPLTLTQSTTIWNTSQIITGDGNQRYGLLMMKTDPLTGERSEVNLHYDRRYEDSTDIMTIVFREMRDGEGALLETKPYPADKPSSTTRFYIDGTGEYVRINSKGEIVTYDPETGKYMTEAGREETGDIFFVSPDIKPTAGTLTIKDGMTLGFEDISGTTDDYYFKSDYLKIHVEGGATADFNSERVSFGFLEMTNGSAVIEKGAVSVLNSVTVGDQVKGAGILTVENGARLDIGKLTEVEDDVWIKVGSLTATEGSTVTVNGELSVPTLTVRGAMDEWGTLTGATGTVTVTQEATFNGKITDLGKLVITGENTTATLNGQTGESDTITTMTVADGATVKLNNGSLTLDYLDMQGGAINLASEQVVLSLKQNPAEISTSVSGKPNIIYGKGILELLNDTNFPFGDPNGEEAESAVGYLGGLKIGKGTASIYDDVTLGSVQFTSSEGGKLKIADGKTLVLSDETGGCSRDDHCAVKTQSGTIISGIKKVNGNFVDGAFGTLVLADGNGSEFFGAVNLDTLRIQGTGKITFGYDSKTASSIIKTLDFVNGGTLIVDKGSLEKSTLDTVTLEIGNYFGNENTKVEGNGTLYIKNGGKFTISNDKSLANLKIGTQTNNALEVSGSFGNIAFDGSNGGRLSIPDAVTVTESIETFAGNRIQGNQLILSGAQATGTFASGLNNLTTLSVRNGATVNINASTQIGDGTGLELTNGAVNIAQGAVLSVSNETFGNGENTVVKGKGTLLITGDGAKAINAKLGDSEAELNTVQVRNVVATVTPAINIAEAKIDQGATLAVKSGKIGKVSAAGTFKIDANDAAVTTAGAFSFAENGGTLQIDGTLVMTSGISVEGSKNNRLTGTGTLRLSGNADSASLFAMSGNNNFDGKIEIGAGKATINTQAQIAGIGFASTNGGTLEIANGSTVNLGKIKTGGTNKITGNGSLHLHNGESEFDAPIGSLGELIVSQDAIASFGKNANISATLSMLTFDGAGVLNIASGTSLTAEALTQQNAVAGSIRGSGHFIAKTKTENDRFMFSTGGLTENEKMTKVTVEGPGTLNIAANSFVGTVEYSSGEGETTVGNIHLSDNVTLKMASDFSGSGKLTGTESSVFELGSSAKAVFSDANGYRGEFKAGRDSQLIFSSEMNNLKKLELNGANAKFNMTAKIGNAVINGGTLTFAKDSTIGAGTVSQGGVVDIDVNTLKVETGNLSFEDSSKLKLYVSRSASNVNGVVSNTGYGKVVVNNGTMTVGNNAALELDIQFGVRTGEDGTIFRFVDGNNTGSFNIINKNERNYSVERVTDNCPTGMCFRLKWNPSVSNLVQELSGTQNQVNAAEAFMGGKLFDEDSKAFKIAEHLDELFANGMKRNYLNALTALAPDVTNAMTLQPVMMHAKMTDAVSKRLSSFSANLGKASSSALRGINQMYGRSGGSPYYKSRFMRPAEYYRRAGYYDENNRLDTQKNKPAYQQPASEKPRIKRTERSVPEEVGTGEQKFYNTREYEPAYKSKTMHPAEYYRRSGYYDENDRLDTQRNKPAYQRRVDPSSEQGAATIAGQRRARQEAERYVPKEFGMWGQTFYNKNEYLSTNKPDGFSGNATGYAFGGDIRLYDKITLGIGYASTSSSVDTLQRSTDVTGKTIFLYGMYKPSEWFYSAMLDKTSMTYTESKDLSGIKLRDKYNGSAFGASFMIGKELEEWTPSFGIRYLSSTREAHQDEIGQNISAISSDVITLVAEGHTDKDFAFKDDSYWHGEFSAALTHDFSSANENASISLPNGASYSVKSKDFSATGIELGGSLSWIYGEHVDITAGYNLEWRQNYLSHTLSASFRYTF